MRKKYVVTLTDVERRLLRGLVSSGKGAARKMCHARILLKADVGEDGSGWRDVDIGESLDICVATVERVRKRFVESGFDAALVPAPSRRVYSRKLDGRAEAHLIALSCSDPPEGRNRWTLRLLADKIVVLEDMDSLSYETVRDVLKKTSSSRG